MVDDQPYVAAARVKEEGNAGEFRAAHGTDLSAADLVDGGTNDEQLFVKKREHFEIVLGNGQRNERQVEPAVEEPGHHFLGDTHSEADFRVGETFAEFAKGTAQLIDQGSNPGGEEKWAPILGDIIFKLLVNAAHHLDDFFGMFSEAQSRRGGNQALAAAHEEIGAEFLREIAELEADSAGGQVNLFRSAGHAGRVHHRQKELKLVDIHGLFYLSQRTSRVAYPGAWLARPPKHSQNGFARLSERILDVRLRVELPSGCGGPVR